MGQHAPPASLLSEGDRPELELIVDQIGDSACAMKRRCSTAGESPARELASLHPEAIGAAVEEMKPSEPPV
jgi:hypothetical protein